jgi:hypothetical protein
LAASRSAALVATAGLAALVGACHSAPRELGPGVYRSADGPYQVAERISDAIGTCWFGGGRPEFAGYVFAPELNSYSDRPRILIVPKANPAERPVLVIEAAALDGGSAVAVYGPLLAEAAGTSLAADVARWSAGATACA